MAQQTHYQVLGISQAATQAEIDAAYRALIKEHHPDSNPGDAGAVKRAQQINEAYQDLKDPRRRRDYDDSLRRGPAGPFARPAGQHTSAPSAGDPADPLGSILRNMQQRAQRAASAEATTSARPAEPPRKSTEVELVLTPEEARNGTSRTLDVDGQSVYLRIPAGQRDRSVLPLVVRVRVRK